MPSPPIRRAAPRAAPAPLALVLGLVLLAGGGLAAPRAAQDGPLLVTLADGASPGDALGPRARVAWHDAAAGVLLVEGADADRLRGHGAVRAVEADARVRAAKASWDTASWDRASWDTASWDRASWDRASWDRASWDRASWDGGPDDAPPAPWALDAIGAPAAWGRGDPEGARLACLVDSGIDAAHPLLAARAWPAGLDLVRGDATPDDEAGHGTHLAGIVAAARDGLTGFRGVGAPLVASAKVLGPDGLGRTSDAVQGILWCRDQGADVILLAFTEDAPTRALHAAIQSVRRDGVLVVASAGNAGPCERCVAYPGAYPEVLAVGATARDGSTPAFSATGPHVSLAAPGAGILSTFPGGAMRVGSGTSQAAAHVAGAAALLLAQHPEWSAGEVERALLHAAADAGRPGRDAQTGHGHLRLDG